MHIYFCFICFPRALAVYFGILCYFVLTTTTTTTTTATATATESAFAVMHNIEQYLSVFIGLPKYPKNFIFVLSLYFITGGQNAIRDHWSEFFSVSVAVFYKTFYLFDV
jgi:hypothetical protein